MLEALHNLEENALDTGVVEALVVASLHKLVEVTLHIFHSNMKLLRVRVQEDIEGRYEVGVIRNGAKENDFAKLETGLKRLKGLFHRLDGNLWRTGYEHGPCATRNGSQLTTVPLRATVAPAVLTRASTTLPKLPSPISLITSNRSSRATGAWEEARDEALCVRSLATVIVSTWSVCDEVPGLAGRTGGRCQQS